MAARSDAGAAPGDPTPAAPRTFVLFGPGGAGKGTIGKVVRVLPDEQKVVVEGVAKVKRHMKPQGEQPGSIVEKVTGQEIPYAP